MDKNILKQYLTDDAVILDAGAFNGKDSIDFAEMFPHGTVYSVEPVSDIYKILVDATKDYQNIKTFQYALDDKNVKKTIFISSGYSNQSSSLLKPKKHLTMFPDCKFEQEEVVQTITINKFVKDNKIKKIDLMWLDLQGNEYKALSKADKILPTVKAIYAEYSLVEFYEGLMLYDEFKEYMNSLGFKEVLNMTEYNDVGVGNSLFVRK